jgi:hypothetical protein
VRASRRVGGLCLSLGPVNGSPSHWWLDDKMKSGEKAWEQTWVKTVVIMS